MIKHRPKIVKFESKEPKGKCKSNMVIIAMGKDDKYKGKCTLAQSGQQRLGGYTAEGFKFYADWRKKIKEARNSPSAKGVEDLALQRVRKDHEITANSYAELRKGQGRRVKSDTITGDQEDDLNLFSDSD